MGIDEYCRKKESIRNAIRSGKAKIQYYEDRATNCTASYSGMEGHGGQPRLQAMEDAVVEKAELQRQIEQYYRDMQKLNNCFRQSIRQIGDPRLEMILELRYIRDCRWKEIGTYMKYGRTQLYRYHSDAVRELERLEKK